MSRSYTPGPEADAVIARLLARGSFGSADEVVRSAVELLEEQQQDLAELRRLVAEGDAAIAQGDVYRYESGRELAADIISGEGGRSKPRP